jgi:hypothetical protein
MSNFTDPRKWDSFPRVHLVAQPLSLGTILLAIGGYFGYHMIVAYSFSEPWWLQLGNLALIAGFAALFAWGMSNMLSLFQRVHIGDGELKLTMFGKVLLQLKESDIRSIRSLCRETTLRNKEVQYYRMYITYRGKKERKLWVDWTIAKEESLREHLPNTLFLM